MVPGSKSIANRALILAALAQGPSTIEGLPGGSRDLDLMLGALRQLGTTAVVDPGSGVVTVTPGTTSGTATVDCGLAGTVMRFVPPAAALTAADVTFDGDARARERPMGPAIRAMRDLGIAITDSGTSRLPFTVHGRGSVAGGHVVVDASASSQFVTALLLSGARFDHGVTVRHSGRPVPSLPHIDMTVRMLEQRGVTTAVETTDRSAATWQVPPGLVRPLDMRIEPDLSNATPFVALALVTGGEVLIRDWPGDSLQPAGPVIDVFTQLGAHFEECDEGMMVTGAGTVNGIDVDLRDLGELVPTIAAVCALADGSSRLSGIGHIAGHETDRLAALVAGITGLGGSIRADNDSLTVVPAPLHGGHWRTYHDHRMATCGAILGAVVPGVLIQDIATTAKTFPAFPQTWGALIATTQEPA